MSKTRNVEPEKDLDSDTKEKDKKEPENKSTFSRLLDAIIDLTKDVFDDGKKIVKKHKLGEKNKEIINDVRKKTSNVLSALSDSVKPKSSAKKTEKVKKDKE